MVNNYKDRNSIPEEFKWDLSDLFADDEAWQGEKIRLEKEIDKIKQEIQSEHGNASEIRRSIEDQAQDMEEQASEMESQASEMAKQLEQSQNSSISGSKSKQQQAEEDQLKQKIEELKKELEGLDEVKDKARIDEINNKEIPETEDKYKLNKEMLMKRSVKYCANTLLRRV